MRDSFDAQDHRRGRRVHLWGCSALRTCFCACGTGDGQPIGGRRGGACVTPSGCGSARGRVINVSRAGGSRRKTTIRALQCPPHAILQQVECSKRHEPAIGVAAQSDGAPVAAGIPLRGPVVCATYSDANAPCMATNMRDSAIRIRHNDFIAGGLTQRMSESRSCAHRNPGGRAIVCRAWQRPHYGWNGNGHRKVPCPVSACCRCDRANTGQAAARR